LPHKQPPSCFICNRPANLTYRATDGPVTLALQRNSRLGHEIGRDHRTVTAKATSDTSERSTLATQFDALLTQINDLTNDASFAGTNLLQAAPDNLTVTFNEDATSTLTISGIDSTTGTGGLNVAGAVSNFGADTDIDAAITAVNSAISTLRSTTSTLGSNATVLQTRLNFTEDLVNTLIGGAGKLTLADLNEESANLLALQTRQQLGINSLSLAAQSERSILALFG